MEGGAWIGICTNNQTKDTMRLPKESTHLEVGRYLGTSQTAGGIHLHGVGVARSDTHYSPNPDPLGWGTMSTTMSGPGTNKILSKRALSTVLLLSAYCLINNKGEIPHLGTLATLFRSPHTDRQGIRAWDGSLVNDTLRRSASRSLPGAYLAHQRLDLGVVGLEGRPHGLDVLVCHLALGQG